MTEREAKQMPIYFVSRALRGPERNYISMEKLILALVHTSKRLKRYFQAHPIIVITNQPIQRVLSRPKVAGRLQKWSIELGEYAIHYRPRVSVKGHILAYFIVERPKKDSSDTLMEVEEEIPEPWILFTDGSSFTNGSGAGLILANPKGVEFTYALRFRFNATNNEAEYEALIVGLRIAEQMGVKNLQENVDSRLVANQVNGKYVAKEVDMIRYLGKVRTLTNSFKAFSIRQIPRSENKKVDALSKIASTSFVHMSKQVLVEELKENSISEVEILAVVEEKRDIWMTPIFKYLEEGTLPAEVKKATAVRRPIQANYVLREIHEESCSMHADYFTKWIEAKPIATITGNQIKKFVWDNIVYKFGLLEEIISDNGKQFRDDPFKDCLEERIKARLDARSKNWMEELPHVLWAHRTMIKSSNGDTPFSLTYGTEAWRERFMNYLEEQTDGEAMINSIQNGDQPFPVIAQVSLARSDALERQMCGFEYGEQDRKAVILYEYETFKATEGEQLLDTYLHYLHVINDLKNCGYKKDSCELNYKFLNNLQPDSKQYGTLMRQTKNLMDISIDALYNILKQNQGDVNDALGYMKKVVVVTSDPLALVTEKTKVSKRKEKVVVSSDSEGSGVDNFSELKKITALLAKDFNRRKFYSKPTNKNLRTSSTSQSTNKKQEFVKSDDKKVKKKDDEKKRDMSKVKCYNCNKEGHFAKDCKKAKVKDYNFYKTKMLLAKKDSDEQVLLAEDHAWMESSSDSDQEINVNMVFMAQIEKVLLDSDESSSSAEETIAEVSYYTSESESESEYETSEYYDNFTNYGLFVNNNDDQEIFHDAIESASENFIENHIDSQKDYDKFEVDHNDSEEKEHLVDKLI
nr:reverse transcriptase domain-containing protein [Tanacetum cinerariifolium]